VTASTKVLLMSGDQTSDIAPSGRPFLAKPFSIADLVRRVRETLDRPSSFARPTKPSAPWSATPGSANQTALNTRISCQAG
jgi:DNA-binding response OmpR family regulator